MLVATTAEGASSSGSAFLIPELKPQPKTLVQVQTGIPEEFGLVVYTGKAVHVTDMLSKAAPADIPADEASAILAQYADELSRLRIGNVVTLEATDTGWHLAKLRERPASKRNPLP
jgi:hypothetical protein